MGSQVAKHDLVILKCEEQYPKGVGGKREIGGNRQEFEVARCGRYVDDINQQRGYR